MAGSLQVLLILVDALIEASRIGFDLGVQYREIETDTLGRSSQMIPLGPPIDGAVPYDLRHLVQKAQTPPMTLRGDTEPRQPVDIRLVFGDLVCSKVLHDRVGSRRGKRYPVKLGQPSDVEHRVRRPQRVLSIKETGIADCRRQNRLDDETDGEVSLDFHQPRRGDV